MDHSACLLDAEAGKQIYSFKDHTGEIVSIQFNTDGDKVLTGSFDYTSRI
jgi:dynein assembly factor with WDR repeat domains 1